MNIVFRSDASLKIGSGHITRCLTLAKALRNDGANVSFICKEYNEHFVDLVSNQHFNIACIKLSEEEQFMNGNENDAAQRYSWQEDAEETKSILEAWGKKIDWLVVDHYQLDNRWESALRPMTARIMVIDDLANRVHDCDLLLDQNMVAEMDSRYLDKVPSSCKILLGPKYSLLQSAYAEFHDCIKTRISQIQRIFIFFSGADSGNLTGKTLSAFLLLNRPDIQVDVVLGKNSPFYNDIVSLVSKHDNIHLHSNLPTLAPLMAKADLAIGAGGATSWERLCLGLPSIVITLADNQVPVATELHRVGLVRWLGHVDSVSKNNILTALENILQTPVQKDWMGKYRQLFDGKGVCRVSEKLTEISN